MALAVTIQSTAGTGSPPSTANVYVLKIIEASIVIDRTPIQAPLPGGSNPLLLDLGFSLPQIVLSGLVEVVPNPTTDGANTIASKQNIEDMAVNWSLNTVVMKITSLSSAGAQTVETYTGKIRNVRFVLSGARPDRWDYSLTFLSQFRT